MNIKSPNNQMKNVIQDIVTKNKSGKETGIFSVCSANEFVLKASVNFAKKNNSALLIEATSNQVDQYGGYTGLTPKDFANYVNRIAKEFNFPHDRLILGGDHLGPNRWQNEDENSAMSKAEVQIKDYIEAGFTKIHLDASMPLGGESANSNGLLNAETVASRAARLCETAERTASETNTKPVYVIGTDVPIPGGAKETEDDIRITPPEELEETINITKKKFYERGLEAAWERVAAVVVQPGVEFSDAQVFDYDRKKAARLVETISRFDSIAFEAHSTDYQRAESLKEMTKDNFAILKVGPWLTFALREALYALELIEQELIPSNSHSHLRETFDKVMTDNPEHWIKHYHGDESMKKISRIYSYSDRIRYYWTNQKVSESVVKLISNLSKTEIPLTLISQFLPNQYGEIRNGKIDNNIEKIIYSKIEDVLKVYQYATGGK